MAKDTLLTIEEFILLPENNFTDREKFAYSLSFKGLEKKVEDWKKLLK